MFYLSSEQSLIYLLLPEDLVIPLYLSNELIISDGIDCNISDFVISIKFLINVVLSEVIFCSKFFLFHISDKEWIKESIIFLRILSISLSFSTVDAKDHFFSKADELVLLLIIFFKSFVILFLGDTIFIFPLSKIYNKN